MRSILKYIQKDDKLSFQVFYVHALFIPYLINKYNGMMMFQLLFNISPSILGFVCFAICYLVAHL